MLSLSPDAEGVAFRKEGVDWNVFWIAWYDPWYCRLPQGRCGLKYPCPNCGESTTESPSARKVWIEMIIHCLRTGTRIRRLPQGRCGLKYYKKKKGRNQLWSPSARKVWIEMSLGVTYGYSKIVAFRKEGVDWNKKEGWIWEWLLSRLPQGRCGLKYTKFSANIINYSSPSARKVWIEIML